MAADSLTPYLGLVKPIVGDEAGEDLWGDKLNGNFDKIDLFARNQGTLAEAPEDGQPYSRSMRDWEVAPSLTQVQNIANAVTENTSDIDAVNTRVDGKAPLGPSDGAIYGWRDTSWFQLSGSGGFTISWDQITGKPGTYPPTLPIPSSGVTGLDAKQASQDSAIAAINWSSLSGKPATFPPTLPIPTSGVTGLDAALAGKEPIIVSGDPTHFWAGDKTWKPVPPAGVSEAPTDGQLYSRKGSTASWVVASAGAVVSDTPPTGVPVSTLWWESDSGALFINYQDPNTTQWVQVNAAGMPEAPQDTKFHARKDGAWSDIATGFLPLTGGAVTGPVQVTATTGASSYVLAATNNGTAIGAGGVIGSTGGIYGIAGYRDGSNNLFSFYGNGRLYVAGAILTAGDVSSATLTSGSMTLSGTLSCGAAGSYFAAGGSSYSAQANPGGYGGFIGFGGNSNIYAILGYQSYALYGTGPWYLSGAITAGSISCPTCTFNVATTTSSATAYLSTGGGLYRSTSSAVFKREVEDLEPAFADKVLLLRTVFYRPNEETVDPTDWSRFGFLTENAYEVDFRYTACSPVPGDPIMVEIADPTDPEKTISVPTGEYETVIESAPSDIDLKAIVACLLDVVRRQGDRIAALEAASAV